MIGKTTKSDHRAALCLPDGVSATALKDGPVGMEQALAALNGLGLSGSEAERTYSFWRAYNRMKAAQETGESKEVWVRCSDLQQRGRS